MKDIVTFIKESKEIKEANDNTIEYKVGFKSKMDASPIRVTVLVNKNDQKAWEKMVTKSEELYVDFCNGGGVEWND